MINITARVGKWLYHKATTGPAGSHCGFQTNDCIIQTMHPEDTANCLPVIVLYKQLEKKGALHLNKEAPYTRKNWLL